MPSIKKSHFQNTPALVTLLTLLTALLLALPASADWLITKEKNKMIETQGSWSIKGGTLTYIDTEGNEKQVSLTQINLVASEKLTAMKAATAVVPKLNSAAPEADPPRTEASETEASEADGEPKITLYMASWCGYCRRTGELLKTMNAAFVEKDIEQDPEAAKEYRQKGNGYKSVPLLDINGRIVKGFNARLIRRLVEEMQRQEAAAVSESASEAAGQ